VNNDLESKEYENPMIEHKDGIIKVLEVDDGGFEDFEDDEDDDLMDFVEDDIQNEEDMWTEE
jgi:hypothetical protein